MFLDELTPVFREVTQQPIAFLGGFFSGVFRLSLLDDPVKSWLDQQTGTTAPTSAASPNSTFNSNGGPQSITID